MTTRADIRTRARDELNDNGGVKVLCGVSTALLEPRRRLHAVAVLAVEAQRAGQAAVDEPLAGLQLRLQGCAHGA